MDTTVWVIVQALGRWALRVLIASTENLAWKVVTSSLTISYKARYRSLNSVSCVSFEVSVASASPFSSRLCKIVTIKFHADASMYEL